MHIKYITLRGFLSYKDATTITFDPKFNVIVGPNGSGKSSLLTAMRFVMGEPMPDKTHYLHQGTSAKALVGYVAMVFDNSDGRMTGFDQTEVIIRRDFSAKKDEISLNGKRVTRHELLSTFEAAGFSKTNPYYFVHQHEVTLLTRMSHAERLKLFKEVAGTSVYDGRRVEAATCLEETRMRRKAIDSTLDVITKRMKELKDEQNELQELIACEKEKKSIEAILTDKEVEELQLSVNYLDNYNEELNEKCTGLSKQLLELKNEDEHLDDQAKEAHKEIDILKSVLETLRPKTTTLEQDITRLLLLQKEKKHAKKEKMQNLPIKKNELTKIQNDIKTIEKQLEELQIELETSERNTSLAEQELMKNRQELNGLLRRSKQQTVYTSVESRNKAFSNDIKTKQRQLKESDDLLKNSQKKLQDLEHHMNQNSATIHQIKIKLEELEIQRDNVSKCIDNNVILDADLFKEQSSLEQDIHDVHQNLCKLDSTIRESTNTLYKTIRPAQLSANIGAMEWARQKKLPAGSVLGTLLENIRVDPKYHIAVETAGGTQLFNLLVRDRHLAVELVEHIKKSKQGSTTIVPLEDIRCREKPITYPLKNSNNNSIIPLVDVIEASTDDVICAVRQVFGRFLLVKSIDEGQDYKSKGFDCITLEGDMISRKGIITGGYRGYQIRLESHTTIQDSQKKKFDMDKKLESLKSRLYDVEIQKKTLTEKDQNDRISLQQCNIKKKSFETSSHKLMREHATLETEKSSYVNTISKLTSEIELLKDDIVKLSEEMTLNVLGNLNSVETKRLNQLSQLVAELETNALKERSHTDELQTIILKHQGTISGILVPQAIALETQINNLESTLDGNLTEASSEETSIEIETQLCLKQNLMSKLNEERVSRTKELQYLRETIHNISKKKEDLGNKRMQIQREYDEVEYEASQNKKQLLNKRLKQDELTMKRQNVAGSSDLILELSKLSKSKLALRLEAVNKKFRSFDGVNRKAVDQFASFIDEETNLLKQRERLYKSEDSILELMNSLDEQKNATLLRAFENVNLQFEKVFLEIVPGGKAKLVLKKLSDEDIAKYEAEERRLEIENQRNVQPLNNNDISSSVDIVPTPLEKTSYQKKLTDIFTGVSVKVQFPSFKGYLPLESLSGGQKSSVALALMFALQRVDSAPFYILDEVDSSLDVQYRSAVATLIQQQAKQNQFIVITHKPETIQAADWCLATSVMNQVTNIARITRDEALIISQSFVNEDSQDENRALTRYLALPEAS